MERTTYVDKWYSSPSAAMLEPKSHYSTSSMHLCWISKLRSRKRFVLIVRGIGRTRTAISWYNLMACSLLLMSLPLFSPKEAMRELAPSKSIFWAAISQSFWITPNLVAFISSLSSTSSSSSVFIISLALSRPRWTLVSFLTTSLFSTLMLYKSFVVLTISASFSTT